MVGLYHHAHKDHHTDQDRKPDGHSEQALGQPDPAEDHDDDAVCVSALVMLGGRSSYSPVTSADYSALMPMDARVGSPLTTAHSALLAHSPPSLLCHVCPVYLRTLALLI
jgi:hypothetical protein